MSNKKSFVLYHDQMQAIEELPSDIFKSIVIAIVEYSKTGNIPELDPLMMALFTTFKNTIDRDLEKYEKTCKRNQENGKKRKSQSKPVGSSGSQKKPRQPKQADSENVSDSDSDIYKEFLSEFNKVTGKRFRVLGDKVKRQLNARLKEGFEISEIISAAGTCKADPYHIENPKYLTPEFITRLDKLQKYSQGDNGDLFTPFTQTGQRIDGEPLCNGLTRQEFIDKFGRIA